MIIFYHASFSYTNSEPYFRARIPKRVWPKEEKTEIDTYPVTIEINISKCSI